MGYYYFSVLGMVPLGIAYAILALTFWGIAVLTRETRRRAVWLILLGLVFLVLPVSEELWIAWNFGQACKEAGTFVYKKVEVDGFYDSTMRSAWENTKPGRYRFVEEATEDRKGFERVEQVDDETRKKALAWYAERNPGQGLPKGKTLFHPISDRERIAVFPNGVDARRIIRLDSPTARYEFKMPASHAPVAHRITKHETVVLDTTSGELLGKYTRISRDSPWFYVSIGKGDFSCDAPGRWPFTRGSFSIFRDILIPSVVK